MRNREMKERGKKTGRNTTPRKKNRGRKAKRRKGKGRTKTRERREGVTGQRKI